MATTNIHATTPTMQYWCDRFEDGESLNELSGHLEKLFKAHCFKDSQSDESYIDSRTIEWFKKTTDEVIKAKEYYYENTGIGWISSFFQSAASTFFGCVGYTTSLQRANLFLSDLNYYAGIVVQEDESFDLEPEASSQKKVSYTPSLEVKLFCELYQSQLKETAQSENKAFCLKVPGEENTSFYLMPDGNSYLVCTADKNNKPNRGGTKEVYRAYDLVNDKPVAFIRSQKDDDPSFPLNLTLVNNEYETLKQFNGSSGILQVRNGFIQNGRACFFSDYYEENSLYYFLHLNRGKSRELSPKQEQHFLVKILEGAGSIHNKGYLHRDFKDPNILVRKVQDPDNENDVLYEPAIIDFECCCKTDDNHSRQNVASSSDYWAPEYAKVIADNPDVLTRKVSLCTDLLGVTNAPMDVWALGIVLYHIHYRKTLIWEGDMPPGLKVSTISNLKDGWFNPKEDDKIGQVIKEMLQVDPSKRMTLTDALLELEKIGDELNESL